ncbi:MAG: site-2 protease family protein [Planctomycetaceae bacterium]|nr:site-2 protease family protein [Planctomycetaceae bacterium]
MDMPLSPFEPVSAASARPARPRSPVRLQALLFILTAATTFAAGVVGWQPMLFGVDDTLPTDIGPHWQRGLAYMAAVMAVLAAHEAGHFIAARIHGIPATLPFFIPVPVLLTGTMGAVIGMEGSRANRRQLFDIALAGPVAGLVVAVPLLAWGMLSGAAVPTTDNPFALPLLARGLLAWVRPDLAPATTIAPNPLFMAGWVGLLVTGLNMIPISQLDGGHVAYAVFGRRGNWLARAVLLAAIATIVVLGQYNWVVMVVVVTLLGVDHPPIRDEDRPPGPLRTLLGLAAFLIPILTFMPEPLAID